MKSIKLLLSALFIFFVGVMSNATAQDASTEEIKIKTSAQCEMCKERIEKAVSYEKGVKKAELNMDTKELLVIYKKGKNNADAIKKAIAKVGYDADEVAAESKAYAKLPNCCKKSDK